ncbi:MAG: hypothetical protein KC917_19590 [Candidatus Omnitrophica bacterium]|nr:hypothetical protein [Candidatus Omnitrophota bacterium]
METQSGIPFSTTIDEVSGVGEDPRASLISIYAAADKRLPYRGDGKTEGFT